MIAINRIFYGAGKRIHAVLHDIYIFVYLLCGSASHTYKIRLMSITLDIYYNALCKPNWINIIILLKLMFSLRTKTNFSCAFQALMPVILYKQANYVVVIGILIFDSFHECFVPEFRQLQVFVLVITLEGISLATIW